QGGSAGRRNLSARAPTRRRRARALHGRPHSRRPRTPRAPGPRRRSRAAAGTVPRWASGARWRTPERSAYGGDGEPPLSRREAAERRHVARDAVLEGAQQVVVGRELAARGRAEL